MYKDAVLPGAVNVPADPMSKEPVVVALPEIVIEDDALKLASEPAPARVNVALAPFIVSQFADAAVKVPPVKLALPDATQLPVPVERISAPEPVPTKSMSPVTVTAGLFVAPSKVIFCVLAAFINNPPEIVVAPAMITLLPADDEFEYASKLPP